MSENFSFIIYYIETNKNLFLLDTLNFVLPVSAIYMKRVILVQDPCAYSACNSMLVIYCIYVFSLVKASGPTEKAPGSEGLL